MLRVPSAIAVIIFSLASALVLSAAPASLKELCLGALSGDKITGCRLEKKPYFAAAEQQKRAINGSRDPVRSRPGARLRLASGAGSFHATITSQSACGGTAKNPCTLTSRKGKPVRNTKQRYLCVYWTISPRLDQTITCFCSPCRSCGGLAGPQKGLFDRC